MQNILLFDYDGVLVDSLEIFMNHFIAACKNEHFSQIHDKKSFLKLFDKNLYESMLEIGMSLETIFRVVHQVRDGLLKDQDKLMLFPGISETVKQLSKNNELMVVTSNESKVVNSFLINQGLTEFSDIYGSDRGGSKVNKINSIKKEFNGGNFYYIGDTKGDIIEGRAANITTIAVTWGWHDKARLMENNPDFLIDNPTDIIEILSA
jgi:phosphoglycolate phosphatase